MNKYELMGVAIVMISVFGGLAFGEYQKAQVDKVAIEVGLEQCVVPRGITKPQSG